MNWLISTESEVTEEHPAWHVKERQRQRVEERKREWIGVRDKERQRESEQHGGIISNSGWGLERNAEVWHTRMWSRFGLVSLFSLPLPLACCAGAQQLSAHISLLSSHHSPATDFLPFVSPLSLSFVCAHTYWCSVSVKVAERDHFYGFSTFDAAGEQIQCLFLAGWRSSTLHSFQMKSLYHATVLRLTFTHWLTLY